MNSSKIEMEKFTGIGDYALWKEKLLAHLELLGLMDALRLQEKELKGPKEPTKSEAEDPEGAKGDASASTVQGEAALEKQRKARSTIILSVSDGVLRKIIRENTAIGMLKALDKLFQSETLPNRIYLKQKLYGFKMTEHQSVENNVDEFLKLITDLGNVKVSISDEDQAILLLMSLPKQFDSLRDTLRYGKSELTLNEVISAINSKQLEFGSMGKGPRNVGEGLYTSSSYRGRPKNREPQNNFRRKDKSRSKSRTKKGTCWTCGKEGHHQRECYSNKPQRTNHQTSEKGEAAAVKGNVFDSDVLTVEEITDKDTSSAPSMGEPEAHIAATYNLENEWILDTGCSFHMTPRREWFSELQETQMGTVRMANNAMSIVKGIGDIKLKTSDGGSITITNVRYVPDFSRNLISLGTLEAQGCVFGSEKGILKVKKGCRTILKAERSDSLYLLKGKTEVGESNHTQATDETRLWHSRLGHMSQKGMDLLVKGGYLDPKKVRELELCENCIYGKAHRVSFSAGKHVSGSCLDYIHADLWGSPHVPMSLGKCQYFLSLIDDHSRKVWIYFLRTKDQAFEKFWEWQSMVERQTGRKVRKLRTDNGLEFCNREFDEHCRKRGIVRHKTIPYTPQQNGVAERMNRTILEKVRSLLSESGMSKGFWAEAANTAVYLINKSPSSAIDFKIPEEVWRGHKIDYSELRVFGSLCYVHNDEGKLQPRAKRGIFLGYPEGVKGYKIWLLDESKTTISRNVKFNEDKNFKNVEESEKEVQESDSPSKISEIDLVNFQENREGKEPAEQSSGGSESKNTIGDDSEEEVDTPITDSDWYTEESTSGLENYLLARDRSRRPAKPNRKFAESNYSAFALMAAEDGGTIEPQNYEEAMRDDHRKDWSAGMDEEMDSLKKNNTWIIVPKPEKKRVIGCKWLYKRKPGIPGAEQPRYKARLVAKGYSQKEGIDYTEIFAPVVKHVSIRLLMSIVVQENMELEQLDVKTAFLHGELEEEIFMSQPEGYEIKGKEGHVCLLKKSLYGLKQSPRQWNQKFNKFMLETGFRRSSHDSCAYIKEDSAGEYIYLLIYVDDMLIASKDKRPIHDLKKKLSSTFEMKDLGQAKRILGIEIERERNKDVLKMNQKAYTWKVLKSFGMTESKTVQTPIGSHMKLCAANQEQVLAEEETMREVPYSNAVGSIMYAMIGTRPDLAHAVGLISRFMSKPIKMHWNAVKWVLRYMRGTTKLGLKYQKTAKFTIQGYCDADYAADLDKRRSISGYTFYAGQSVISWRSGLQKVVALSTTESEYMALTEAVKEGLWLKGLFEDFGYTQESVEIFCDSQSAIALSKNNVHHERTKHIDIKLHFIRDKIAEGLVKVTKVHTSVNPADVFTKVLPASRFKELLNLLGLVEA